MTHFKANLHIHKLTRFNCVLLMTFGFFLGLLKANEKFKYDVVVYGGTPAGVTASIQAAKEGKRVVLLSFNQFVGGLSSGGLSATDVGNKKAIGGLAREFYSRVGLSNFKPSKAESAFLEMLKEVGVEVKYQQKLKQAIMNNHSIVELEMLNGIHYEGKVFIDSTYEGDLFAAANVSYYVGRENRDAYNESLAGQWQSVSWKNTYQFCNLPIDPYKVKGDPSSGLLKEISNEPIGEKGDGDYKVQAYNFRMFLSNKKDRVPFYKPNDYDPSRYNLLARFINMDSKIDWKLNYTSKPMTDGPVQLRVGDSNNAGSFSSDYVGGSYYWPDGTYSPDTFSSLPKPKRGLTMPFEQLYAMREKIFEDHINYQQGLMYFLSTDSRVPKSLRDRVNKFGLDPNEFSETNHWPHQLYIREGRRMVSDYVVTQADCNSKTNITDSVGLASYPMDSHFCQRVVVKRDGGWTVRNEGGFGHHCPKPYPIAYRAIVPKQQECDNLLVPVCLSSSHVAYGSIRMEPVFMILGQSAGAAATIAIDKNISVQKVDYRDLKSKLLKAKQILGFRRDS